MKIGYVRVSAQSQHHDLQIDALKQAGVEKLFIETASGARADRPELAKALEMLRPNDVFVLWRLDRAARSLKHLIEIAAILQQREVALRSLSESIDTSTASGRFLFHVLASVSEMEREIIIERTRAGLAAAAARGRRGGRPKALSDTTLKAAMAMMTSGSLTATEIAKQVGCSPSTLYRHIPGGRSALAAR